MSSKGRMIVAGAAIAAAACLVTACGGTNSTNSTNTSSTNSTSSTSSTSNAGSASAAAPASSSSGLGLDRALSTTTNSKLGTIVVDGSGRTLYRFDKDSASPPTSNCTGACAQLWPPVLVGTQISLSGVDRSLLGTIRRSDGSVQLTLHGWPLYRYAGDSAPGQINGEGLDGTWFAVRPTGAKALTASTRSASTSTGSTSTGSTSTGTSTGSTGTSTGSTSSSGGGYGY
jgi:predicted lipoprotein with Yx(FWY)xxD motif